MWDMEVPISKVPGFFLIRLLCQGFFPHPIASNVYIYLP